MNNGKKLNNKLVLMSYLKFRLTIKHETNTKYISMLGNGMNYNVIFYINAQ